VPVIIAVGSCMARWAWMNMPLRSYDVAVNATVPCVPTLCAFVPLVWGIRQVRYLPGVPERLGKAEMMPRIAQLAVLWLIISPLNTREMRGRIFYTWIPIPTTTTYYSGSKFLA
jgi:hypothetical protein